MRFLRWAAMLAVGIPAALWMALLVAQIIMAIVGPGILQRELNAMRTDGIPTTPAELQAPLPPPSQNAAGDYLALTRLLKTRRLDRHVTDALRHVGEIELSQDELHRIRELLAGRQDVVGLVDTAVRKPRCVFRRDWKQGPFRNEPEIPTLRAAAGILLARGYLLARSGHYEEAVAEDAKGFQVARQTAEEPGVVPYLVAVSIDSRTLRCIQDVMVMAGPDRTLDSRVMQMVRSNHLDLNLRHAMAGEVVNDIALVDLIRKGENMGPPVSPDPTSPAHDGFIPRLLLRRGLPNLMLAELLHQQRRLIESMSKPESERREAVQRTEKAIFQRYNNPWVKYNPVNIIPEILLPLSSGIVDRGLEQQEEERVTLAGASVLEWRSIHGVFPARLADAMTAVPVDPFTQRRLPYRRAGEGFIVYSVGQTGRFDGVHDGPRSPSLEAVFPRTSQPSPGVSMRPVSVQHS